MPGMGAPSPSLIHGRLRGEPHRQHDAEFGPAGREVKSMRPRWRLTMMLWAMCSPSPVPTPCGLVVKNGSKILAAISGGMPGPVSAIADLDLVAQPPRADFEPALAVHRLRSRCR